MVEPALRGGVNASGPGWLADAARFLPWAAGSALQEGAMGTPSSRLGQGGLSPLAGSAVFLGVVVTLTCAAAVLFSRRDLVRTV
ncbi:MAG TPA: hypothetical protein VFR07_17775 [Mycobacteriales bacterium]|jgi:ABC-type transport system involved in multi-copper enzyme maturation permease subunit|nr:hypothetical protein [Mycobacteriales bacterium]